MFNIFVSTAHLLFLSEMRIPSPTNPHPARFPTFRTFCTRVLPINVMACRKMLVLCGDTYMERLWCAWELFTLFSFQAHSVACNKLELIILQDEAAQDDKADLLESVLAPLPGEPVAAPSTTIHTGDGARYRRESKLTYLGSDDTCACRGCVLEAR